VESTNLPSEQDAPQATAASITPETQDTLSNESTEAVRPVGAVPVDAETASTVTAKAALPDDPFAHLKQAQKKRENVQARVVKWQRNGLEMELEDGTKAFMPNDMIDRDPNRNIAHYFGKTLPVRITNVKVIGKKAEVAVSHRAVIDDEIRTQGKEKIQALSEGDIVDCKVRSFNMTGAVVDIGAGIDATIRTRDLTWEKVEHPYDVVKRGDTVQAKILQLDRGRRRAQLGIRQLTPDPFLQRFSKYELGSTYTGKISRINEFGAEVEFEPGISAFLPISELSWVRISTVGDAVQVGEEVEVKLITTDTDARKLTASKKALIENPLRKIENTFRVGTDHTGTIKEVNRGGVVVALEHGAEGFVPRRELSHDRVERLEDLFKPGKELEGLRVMEYDRRNGRVTLSYIAAERDAQRTALKDYKPTSSASSFAIGDLASLKEKLEKLERGS
jgi:small subunit ribosomal protein S1